MHSRVSWDSKYASRHRILTWSTTSAHSQAWEAGVLHRDISDSNIRIIIRDDGTTQGLLLDWDLCKYKDELANGATAISRSVKSPPSCESLCTHMNLSFAGNLGVHIRDAPNVSDPETAHSLG